MSFKFGDRVEHTDNNHMGTVTKDNGMFVWVKWDNGEDGVLIYNKTATNNAYHLIKLVNKKANA